MSPPLTTQTNQENSVPRSKKRTLDCPVSWVGFNALTELIIGGRAHHRPDWTGARRRRQETRHWKMVKARWTKKGSCPRRRHGGRIRAAKGSDQRQTLHSFDPTNPTEAETRSCLCFWVVMYLSIYLSGFWFWMTTVMLMTTTAMMFPRFLARKGSTFMQKARLPVHSSRTLLRGVLTSSVWILIQRKLWCLKF